MSLNTILGFASIPRNHDSWLKGMRRVNKIMDEERINLLKPDLGTKPKVFYIGIDREVK